MEGINTSRRGIHLMVQYAFMFVVLLTLFAQEQRMCIPRENGKVVSILDRESSSSFVVIHMSSLQCYQCINSPSYEDCNVAANLKECEEDVALVLDVCETVVKDTGTGLIINKRCGKGPCSFANKNQNAALNIVEADCNGNKCHYCCNSDGCNDSSGSRRMLSSSLTILITLILYVFVHLE